MLDESVCLLCGRSVAPNNVYCSRECSNIDSSSSNSASASAVSSAQHSPVMYPVDSNVNNPHSEVPALIHAHFKNRQSMSSNSTLDSDDYVYGANRRPSINYSRRPSATNQRSTIPSLPLLMHRRTSSATSEVSYSHVAEQDPSFAIAKALNNFPIFSARSAITTSSSSSSSPDFSSDEEQPPSATDSRFQRGGVNQRTITSRYHPRHNTGVVAVAANNNKKHHHRVSLPAYFSRLSVEATNGLGSVCSAASFGGEGVEQGSVSDHDTPIQPHGQARSYPSPPSNLSSSSGFHTSATLTSAGARLPDTTPRGRGRDRRVRQGASRSPQPRTRRSNSRSLSPSFSRSRSPSLSASPYQLRYQPQTTKSEVLPRTAPLGAVSPITTSFGLHSLGERAYRVNEHLVQQVAELAVEEDAVPRGRRARGEDEPLLEGEERERGRSRVVVKRGSIGSGAGVVVQ